MKIDPRKTCFTPSEKNFILSKLEKAEKMGYLLSRSEDNCYLLVSYKGVEEKGISPKWNVKIYTYNEKKGGHSLVCVDTQVLGLLLNEDYASFIPPELPVLRIDDAGWGFPLCGVMVGVSDDHDVKTSTVPVEYFRKDGKNGFRTRRYLKKYGDLAIQLLEQFGAAPGTHRIEICTGYVNQPLRERLRKLGYDVRVVEIKGLLQRELENLYRAYVIEEVGSDIYYDPKEMQKREIPRRYRECLEFGQQKRPDLVKTGWEAISG